MQSNLGFIFPGQGSQKVGMLAELAAAHPVVQETFAEASAALGYDLWALVQQGPEKELALTRVTQPAILSTSVALWRLWAAQGGPAPALMAGHSLGEYSALTCAGVLAFPDAVQLVQTRGELMQNAVPVGEGAMAAIIGLDDDKVIAACEQAGSLEDVAAVNFNCPGQVVIAGRAGAVEQACGLCRDAGAKRALPLPVSAPFHSRMMRPAADRFEPVIAGISMHPPQIPVLQNVTLETSRDPEQIRDNLVKHFYHPVPWVDTVRYFADQGITAVVELGPGRVLNGFNKRIAPDMTVVSVNDPDSLASALHELAS